MPPRAHLHLYLQRPTLYVGPHYHLYPHRLIPSFLFSSPQSVIDAQFLANQVQLYYASEDDSSQLLVAQFNAQPDRFDYTKLFEHLQTSVHSHLPHTENTA